MLRLLEFLLSSIVSILGYILLLRAWIYVWAFSPRHPIVDFTHRTTNWVVEPLAKLIPRHGAWDFPSLVAAFIAALLTMGIHIVLGFVPKLNVFVIIAPFAMMLRWGLEMLGWSAFLWVFLTWINPQSPLTYGLGTLIEPFIRPLRRLPLTVGRFDFSPVVLFILVNLILMVIVPLSQGYLAIW